jgi:hypothetical protein
MGTAQEMGPGYFPSIVGAALTIIGFALSVGSLRGRSESEAVSLPAMYPLVMITGAVVCFALLLEPLGLVLALFVLISIACLASPQVRLRDVMILYVSLVSISVSL